MQTMAFLGKPSGKARRFPQFLVCGPFNNWGADKGIPHLMEQNDDGLWELELWLPGQLTCSSTSEALTIFSMVMWTAMVSLTVFLPTRLRPTTSKYLPRPLPILLGPSCR